MVLRTMAPHDDFTTIDRHFRTYLAAGSKMLSHGPGFKCSFWQAVRHQQWCLEQAIAWGSR